MQVLKQGQLKSRASDAFAPGEWGNFLAILLYKIKSD